MGYKAIVNAAPMINLLGTQDLSTKQLVREPVARPTHLPKFYLYTKKGPTTPQLVVGDSRSIIYGEESFDLRQKWANHATVFANGSNAEGNACMIQRILPADAGPAANLLLSLDVLETDIDDYERNTDGSIRVDTQGTPVVKGQIPGFKVKWVVTSHSTVADMQTKYGKATVGVGTQTTGGARPVTSQLYPIMELKMSYIGADGNDTGLRVWAPNSTTGGGFDTRVLTNDRVYPFRVSVIRRNTKTGTARVQETIFGEQSVLTTLKPGAINSITDQQLTITENLLNAYRNVDDPRYPPNFGEFGDVVVYNNNVKTLLDKFYQAEKEYIDAAPIGTIIPHDFSTATGLRAGDEWLFNMFTGASVQAYPYHTFQVDATGTTLGEYTNLYAGGSADGTMNDTLFAGLVADAVSEYRNENSQLHNTALNVESIIYDSGFPLETKYALCSFIAVRKDTFVALSTHEVGGLELTAGEDNSLAVALRTRLMMYPESDYFGTPVMRGMIMGRSGKIRASQFKERVSPLYEVMVKASRYMGAGNGVWKSGRNFDGAPGSILDYIYDVSVPYTPVSVRNRDWDAGLNWVQSYDMRSEFIPALKTVYNDDTSVLNSFLTAMAICEINKVCEMAWRYFSGVSYLTNGQLAERVDNFIRQNLNGRFDDRFIIEPETYYTDADIARGYSWMTKVKIYAANMKTVMQSYVQAFRLDDYQQS